MDVGWWRQLKLGQGAGALLPLLRLLADATGEAGGPRQGLRYCAALDGSFGCHRGMRHLRSQPVSSAGLSPHELAAWSHRLTPQSSARLVSTPHSSPFGGGCRDQVGTADEDNHATITAAGMAGHDVAASGPYRVCPRDRFCLRDRGHPLSGSHDADLRCDTWNRPPLSCNGHHVVAPSSIRWEAQVTGLPGPIKSAKAPRSPRGSAPEDGNKKPDRPPGISARSERCPAGGGRTRRLGRGRANPWPAVDHRRRRHR
jgi:hypothetical protein